MHPSVDRGSGDGENKDYKIINISKSKIKTLKEKKKSRLAFLVTPSEQPHLTQTAETITSSIDGLA